MDTEFKMPRNLPLIVESSNAVSVSENNKEIPSMMETEDNTTNTGSDQSEEEEVNKNVMQPPSMKPPTTGGAIITPPKPKKPQETLAEKQAKYAEIIASLKYHAPEQGAQYADPRYGFEVLKTGTIVDRVKFRKMDNKGFYIVGRVPACDVVAENPTVSRTHAILQFVQGPPEGNKKKKSSEADSDKNGTDIPTHTGLYLYDLNSTHGTFINKNQIYPNRYYRLHVGHVLKFGNSTRLYVLLGPEEDEEEESEKSVTELQNEKLQKELERKRLEAEGILIKPGEVDEDGCTWGMGADAEEESDMRENPFAINFEESESFDNPKKTLRGWFEREGYDLVYDCREKAPGQFICRINLPIDGPAGQAVFAEVDHKGKKKEAVHQAALQACQILDKYGVLRQSHHESKSKRKDRDWKDQDYYSSDEDTFLDRTGSVEKKREKRMKIAGKVEEKVQTYESLRLRSEELQGEIENLHSQISKAQAMDTGDEEVDIDDYVNSLKAGVADVKKLKAKLREASEDLKNVNKLMNIAKPASLPIPLLRAENKTLEKPSVMSSFPDKKTLDTPIPPNIVTKFKDFSNNDDKKEKFSGTGTTIDDDEMTPCVVQTSSSAKTSIAKDKSVLGPKIPEKIKDELSKSTKALEKHSHEEKVVSKNSDSSDDEDEVISLTKKKKRNRQRQKVTKEPKYEYDDNDPKYSTWVPPSDQRGDGKTSLNEKLGY